MAHRLDGLSVYAYDTDVRAQDLCRALAQANGLASRVHVRGLCDLAELNARVNEARRPLVIIDCEGCEAELIDSARVPGLAKAVLVIEVHEVVSGLNLLETLRERMTPTHIIDMVASAPPAPEEAPELTFLPLPDRVTALTERMITQHWLYLAPRATASS